MPSPTASSLPPHVKAHATGRWAEILFRALSSRVANRWQFISFRGLHKGEWRGVVDVLAIRKDTSQPKETLLNRGDLFDIVLIQVKGGGAKPPTKADCIRLRTVARRYNARAVVLFQWRKGQSVDFFRLNRRLEWVPTTSRELFE
jgi:hypothetical protein